MKKYIFIPALLCLVCSVFTLVQAQEQLSTPKAGKDYIEIRNGTPLKPADGKVVVEEFFNYICPSCNSFEPIFEDWTKHLPPYVRVDLIPATFRADFMIYARAYYAAKIYGLVDKTHKAVYDAIHNTHKLPAEGDKIDEKRIAEFYSHYGVDAKEFLHTMNSYRVEIMIRRVTQHMQKCKVPSTPSIVVNGRYLVRGKSYEDMLRITNYLIAKERSGQ